MPGIWMPSLYPVASMCTHNPCVASKIGDMMKFLVLGCGPKTGAKFWNYSLFLFRTSRGVFLFHSLHESHFTLTFLENNNCKNKNCNNN